MAEYNNANEPAFSKAAFYHPDGGVDSPQSGLTKREYFAAMAMQGYLASFGHAIPNSKHIAEKSVEYADAVLKQLEETSNPS